MEAVQLSSAPHSYNNSKQKNFWNSNLIFSRYKEQTKAKLKECRRSPKMCADEEFGIGIIELCSCNLHTATASSQQAQFIEILRSLL